MCLMYGVFDHMYYLNALYVDGTKKHDTCCGCVDKANTSTKRNDCRLLDKIVMLNREAHSLIVLKYFI